jgi:hypothetical protein
MERREKRRDEGKGHSRRRGCVCVGQKEREKKLLLNS